jgi:hypothetical protein
MRKMAILAVVSTFALSVVLAGCLGGDNGDGGGGGYTTTIPVEDLIVDESDLEGWFLFSSSGFDIEIGGSEDVAIVLLFDSESILEANHTMSIGLFQMAGTVQAGEAYQELKAEYQGNYTITEIDVGPEGFWAELDETTHLIFTKYRYITIMIYAPIGGEALTIEELIDIAEIQAEKLVYN